MATRPQTRWVMCNVTPMVDKRALIETTKARPSIIPIERQKRRDTGEDATMLSSRVTPELDLLGRRIRMTSSGSIIGHNFILQMLLLLTNVFAMNRTAAGLMRLFVSYYKIVLWAAIFWPFMKDTDSRYWEPRRMRVKWLTMSAGHLPKWLEFIRRRDIISNSPGARGFYGKLNVTLSCHQWFGTASEFRDSGSGWGGRGLKKTNGIFFYGQ